MFRNKKIFYLFLIYAFLVFSPVVKASEGCCSQHFGEGYCGDNGHIICNDEWESSCICNPAKAKASYESQKDSNKAFVVVLLILGVSTIIFIFIKKKVDFNQKVKKITEERNEYLQDLEKTDEYSQFIEKIQSLKIPTNKRIIHIYNFGKMNHELSIWGDSVIYLAPLSTNAIIFDAFKKNLATDNFVSNIKDIFVDDYKGKLNFAKGEDEHLIEKKHLKDENISSDIMFEVLINCKNNQMYSFKIDYPSLVSLNGFYKIYTINNDFDHIKVFNERNL